MPEFYKRSWFITQQAFTPKLNWIAEFTDTSLEISYFQRYMDSARKTMVTFIILIGATYFALGFISISLVLSKSMFIFNFILRSIVFACAILNAFLLMRTKNTRWTIVFTLIFFVLFVVSYQLMLFLLKSQDFSQQGMSLILIVCAIFLVPNRWIYSLVFSIGAVLLFLIVTPLYIKDVPLQNMFLGPIIGIILSATHSYCLHKYRRLQFFKERQLEVLSTTDRLTGIYNRQKFDETLHNLIEIMNKDISCFAIIMFDLDKFKVLNDTHGHMMGDKVLTACSDAVLQNIRTNEILARWGGEEFMILLPSTTLSDATILAERLRKIIENLTLEDRTIEEKVRITASFGVTRHYEGDTMDTLISRVDGALYHAKETGRNRVSTK